MGQKSTHKKQADRFAGENPYLSKSEKGHFGYGDVESPYVVLKYFDPSFECFSNWEKQELKKFSDFTKKIKDQKWSNIIRSGGNLGNKTGLGYTAHKRSNLPRKPALDEISEEIPLFELRFG